MPAAAPESDRADCHRRRVERRQAHHSRRHAERRSHPAWPGDCARTDAGPGRGDLTLRGRRLRPEELAADADRAGRRRCAAARIGPSSWSFRALRYSTMRASVRRAGIACGSAPTGRDAWSQPSTRWMPRPRGTICFPPNTRRCRRACTGSKISAATSGWCAPMSRRRATCVRPSSMPPVSRWSLRSTNWRTRLDQDPVALRLANDTATDPITRLPFSSRHLAECLRRGAERLAGANERWRRNPCAPTTDR